VRSARFAAAAACFLALAFGQAAFDRDGDGLTDEDELDKYFTDPLRRDTDANKAPDAEWGERFKYTTVVRAVVRVARPCLESPVVDAWQDVRVLARGPLWSDLEVTGVLWRRGLEPRRLPDPLSLRFQLRSSSRLAEDWYGRSRPGAMGEWLQPRKVCDWDASLASNIRAEFRAQTGVAVESLSDGELVALVSSWLHATSRCVSRSPLAWMVDATGARPVFHPDFLPYVGKNLPPNFTNHEAYAGLMLSGRAMYRRKTYEWGLPWCVYAATVLRALGVPTRIVTFAPLVDGESKAPLDAMGGPAHLRPVRRVMEGDVRYVFDHGLLATGLQVVVMNEVFVGGRWVLLNLPKDLGGVVFPAAPIQLHVTPGYLLRVHQMADPSEVRFDETWGRMAAGLPVAGAIGAGGRPWRTVSMSYVVGRQNRLVINGLRDGRAPLVAGWEGEDYARAVGWEEGVLATGDDRFQRLIRGAGLYDSPTSLDDLPQFQVYPAWNPSKDLIESFGGKKPLSSSLGDYTFFPEDPAVDREPTAAALSNKARPDDTPPATAGPSVYKVLEAFWVDAPSAPLGLLPLPSGADDSGRPFFIRIRRESGKEAGDDAFLRNASREWTLKAEGQPPVPVETLTYHDRDCFLLRVPWARFVEMPKEKPYRLVAGKQQDGFTWFLQEEVILRR